MLSILSNTLRTATRRPIAKNHDHWTNHHTRRSNAQLEREAAEWRYRRFRDVGMW